jgi:tRNA A-37 threonylcarbamoyl transferase component Bud32
MSTDPDSELLKIAEKVSDAESVDWDEASGAHPALTPTLEKLRRVEAVAGAFRAASPNSRDESNGELRVWGRLDVLELIGSGSFGEVYRARDPLLDREVALKLRRATADDDASSARRALDEGKRLARVRHPDVLTVHGADEDDGRVGLWTELVDGPDLREVVDGHGPLNSAEAVTAAIAVCRALNAVHGADLVHGDVKASNVFRDRDGRIVLGDFGSASELDSSGTVSGSPVALSPERLRGAPAEPASDLYSVGVLLFFMLSGRYPVEGTGVEDLLDRHERVGPVPLGALRPELPSALTELVDRAVDADPARRFTTARELEHALERVQAALTAATRAPATTPEQPERSVRPTRLRTWSVVLAMSAAALLGVVGWGLLSPAPNAPLTTDATLVLDRPGGPVVLEDGSAVSPGDHLYLELETGSPVHVYVANEDDAGDIFTLFPIPGLDLANPLPPGRHRLPGTVGGATTDWQVTSAGGVETFLVIASAEPIPEIERRLARWAVASAARAVSSTAGTEPDLRGIGGLSAPPGPGDGARLEELQRELAERDDTGRRLWSRRIMLRSSQE